MRLWTTCRPPSSAPGTPDALAGFLDVQEPKNSRQHLHAVQWSVRHLASSLQQHMGNPMTPCALNPASQEHLHVSACAAV